MHELTSRLLAELFGAAEEEILTFCGDMIDKLDFRYRKLEGKERDQLILKVLSTVDGKKLPKAGVDRLNDWEKGWSENFKGLEEGNGNIENLVPEYYQKNVPIRLLGDYVLPKQDNFVLNITKVFRSWLFQKYFQFQYVEQIHEFGCGSGWHLAYLASIFHDKRLYGYDWSKTSQKIIKKLYQQLGCEIQGRHFDFFHPDYSVSIAPKSAVYTFGALEQVGINHGPFLKFLLEKLPEICINIEPLHELYNTNNLLDCIALRYHKYRNYLEGYLTQLQELESEGRIEILKIHHQQFGNLYNDTHSYVVWRPIRKNK